MLAAGVLIRAAACSRSRTNSVRIQPLGSPTGPSKRSYVHAPGVPLAVVCTVLVDVRAGRRGLGGVPGGWYTGYYPAPSQYTRIGIARAQPLAIQPLSASTRHSGTLQAPPHTWLLALSIPASRTNMARFH